MACGGVRAVARAYLVVGLAVTCFALYAISLDPATFQKLQLQMTKDPPEPGQIDCVVTAAHAVELRAHAAVLLLWAASEALMAMVALATTSRFFTIWAQVVSLGMAPRLLRVVDGVIDLAVGRCHGVYHQALDTGYVNVTVFFGLLSLAGFLVALFDDVDG